MDRSACLLFQCIDQVGIIAELVTFFRDHNISISRLEEYTDNQYFFARLEWAEDDLWSSKTEFTSSFFPIASKFKGATFRVHFFQNPQKLGLFSSKEPHTLIEAINRCEAGDFPNTQICFLVSNSKEIERYADRHDIPFHFVKTWKDPKRHEPAQLEIIQKYKPCLLYTSPSPRDRG